MTTTDETHEFTEQEFQFIFGMCSGLGVKEIAAQHKMAEDVVRNVIYQKIFDKVGVSNRVELYLFASAALNAELRSRRG